MTGATDSRAAPAAAIAGHRLSEVLKRRQGVSAYRATAPDGARVVLQVCSPAAGEAAAGRLRAHAKALSELSHPALPRVTGFGEAPEGAWMATAEVEGLSLRDLLAERVAPMRAVRLLGEVADGLDVAHRAGIAHGDVRPENIVVQSRPTERAQLVDFPFEPAPPAADVPALAATLRECTATSGAEPLAALDRVIARGLDPDPARRYETPGALMSDAARSLLEAAPTAPVPATPAPEPATIPSAPAPRRRLLGALATVLAVGAAAAGGYAAGRGSESSEPPVPRTATAGELEIRVPGGWQRAQPGVGAPRLTGGLSLRDPGGSAVIRTGIAADRGAVLDPSRLVDATAPRPRTVRAGRLRALRFEPRGRQQSVVYVAPTSAGAATIACSGAALPSACDEAAAGLRLRGARGYDPVAGIAWRNRLAAQMSRLRSRRAAGLRGLRQAPSRGAQAARAAALARLYAATARRLRAAEAPPQAARAQRRVIARLGSGAGAYRRLARAARTGNEAAFGSARQSIRRADRRLRVTLRSL